jgi:phage terminase small subunit
MLSGWIIMPARKPFSLHNRHATKAEKAARAEAESSMVSDRSLPKRPPPALRDHKIAGDAWRKLIRMYEEIEGELITRLDMDILITYCLLWEQVGELDLMRKTTYRQWLELGAAHDKAIAEALKAKRAAEEIKKAVKETGGELPEKGPGSLAEVEKWEAEAIDLATTCLNAFEAIVKLDSRADRKRDLIIKLGQSLYLNPRSRAGATPDKKKAPEPIDPMDALLDDVSIYLNGDSKTSD